MSRSFLLVGLGTLSLTLLLAAAGSVSPEMHQAHVTINGPFCSGCVPGLKTLLEEIEGVEAVEIDVEARRIAVTFDPDHTSSEALLAYVDEETTFELILDDVVEITDDANGA